jgi:hypothetical protein
LQRSCAPPSRHPSAAAGTARRRPARSLARAALELMHSLPGDGKSWGRPESTGAFVDAGGKISLREVLALKMRTSLS